MTRKVSKLDASRVLEVSPSTIDRRIERGELQIEHEPRGNSYKVWVLLDDEVNDVPPAEVPGIAGVPGAPPNTPTDSTEIRLLKQEVQHLQELAEYRREALNESEKRFHGLLEGFNASQRTVETLTRALNPGSADAGSEVAKNGRRSWWRSIFR